MPTDSSRNAPEAPSDPKTEEGVGPTVRFKSTVQEIDPQKSRTLSNSVHSNNDSPAEVSPEDIRALSKSLQGHRLQERRMNIFSFEPYSLPASRVCLTQACFDIVPATLLTPVSPWFSAQIRPFPPFQHLPEIGCKNDEHHPLNGSHGAHNASFL